MIVVEWHVLTGCALASWNTHFVYVHTMMVVMVVAVDMAMFCDSFTHLTPALPRALNESEWPSLHIHIVLYLSDIASSSTSYCYCDCLFIHSFICCCSCCLRCYYFIIAHDCLVFLNFAFLHHSPSFHCSRRQSYKTVW